MITPFLFARKIVPTFAVALALVSIAGCPQPAPDATASFVAGSGANDFGTIDNAKGSTFQISQGGGGFGVSASGNVGTATFEADETGRLTHIDNSLLTADLVYNADGSAAVTGTIMVANEVKAIDGTIPASEIPAARKLSAAQTQGSICGVVDRFCTNLDAILLFLEVALLNEAGHQANPNGDPFITLANTVIEDYSFELEA